ncbi:MAG: T9SS type A sorting domain-containing protein [Saprospiraceae bacterium]|nr:T9SS type A sorting domain-containing protein [Saprospiraceae bacterium]
MANFRVEGPNLSQSSLRIFDLKGNLVRETAFSGNQTDLNVQDWPTGVYVWELKGPGWRKSGKLVKE